MSPHKALRLTIEQRLGFEVTAARARVTHLYEQMQHELHQYGKYPESTQFMLHEAERVVAALERVSGEHYRRVIADEKAYREEQKKRAEEEARYALEAAQSRKTRLGVVRGDAK